MGEDIKTNNVPEKDVKLGLQMSDADDYHLNASVPETAVPQYSPEPRSGKKRGRSVVAFLLGMLCCLVLLALLTELLGIGKFVSRDKYDYYRDLDNSYGKYYEIMKLIGEDPIAKSVPEDISDEKLKELVASTGDPYAEYFTAEEYAEFEKKYAGDYVGIGVGVVQEGEDIVVITVFEDSPAEEAGIEVDDKIVAVDGEKPADIDDAVDMLSGEPGTAVTVTVSREGEEIEMKTNRARIDQDSVAYAPMDDHPEIGAIMINSFMKGTADEFKTAVKDLKSQGCEKFIIDLRNNGGGITDESIEIADYLLPACTVMSETSKNGEETVHNSKASTAGLKYVVLVNGNTASASEILSAAIQDNKGGLIIGEKTYGKGVTQLSHKFRDGSAIKITVTEYFRPNGGKVDGIGITPDIEAAGKEAVDKAVEELEK